MEIGARRRAIGDAIWLLAVFGLYAEQSEADWWLVGGGDEISDERIGVYLDISAARAKKWRVRLEKLGLIRTEMIRPLQRKFWLRNPDKMEQATALEKTLLPMSRLVH